jgi:hypothetical protein
LLTPVWMGRSAVSRGYTAPLIEMHHALSLNMPYVRRVPSAFSDMFVHLDSAGVLPRPIARPFFRHHNHLSVNSPYVRHVRHGGLKSSVAVIPSSRGAKRFVGLPATSALCISLKVKKISPFSSFFLMADRQGRKACPSVGSRPPLVVADPPPRGGVCLHAIGEHSRVLT